jgi:hypothetical protein
MMLPLFSRVYICTYKQVDVYAKDSKQFNADFAKTFQKLEELGTKNLVATEWA